MSKQALLIFTKNPKAGKVKTRLAETVGIDKAFSVYQQLLKHTASISSFLPVDKIVFYSSYIEQNDIWNDNHYQKQVQHGNDLGERMNDAFKIAFQCGYDNVVIIGTDCPEINSGIIMNAFEYLNNQNVVIGPTKDGGYYLLGMKQYLPQLFEGIQWSTSLVFDNTVTICETHNISYTLLPMLNDVDEEKDLVYLQK